ncbi:RAQPRD family integrative conjugative element protein [Vibrio mediterranei]|uniref:integrative conjugative element protein, RAQPRD family n=1 Tax=Vibrio mediterranei TaxID=689 RepID=UPI0038CEE790
MKWTILLCMALALPAHATVENEHQELSLLLSQLHQLDYLITRAEREADYRPRRQFDYNQLRQDLRTIQSGVDHYLRPERQEANPILPIYGDYVSRRDHEQ